MNAPGGTHGLPAVVLAKLLGHASGRRPMSCRAPSWRRRSRPCARRRPAPSVDHPNLAAWRTVLGELESNPARTAYAVFVGDLDDPVESEADATLRTLL